MTDPTRTGQRASFESSLSFSLDPFQIDAFDALDGGKSVLVAAPTGSGKTLVAEYAVAAALAAGAKVFYTTPLKALSNQKYGDLVKRYGTDAVGLLTGDNSINGDAAIVVMTTEVLRNMIYARSRALDGLRYVVLDEVHYLQDRTRGPVWEEVIIHLPPTVDLVCLSATVSNAEEFADWIHTVRGETVAVIEERRPVDLVHLYLAAQRGRDHLHLLPTFIERPGAEPRPNPEAARLDRVGHAGGNRGRGGRPRSRLAAPGRVETVELLDDEDMLPAIVFVFSRNGCDKAVAEAVHAGLHLTTAEERAEIRRIADAHLEGLTDDDLDVLGWHEWITGLENGFAAHHAGLVPPMKEAVEEAFAAGLVKVVYATETLSLGINMPARTVVIEKLSKFTGQRHEFLTPGEYTQLAGRAGRRGIDSIGYVVVCWNPFVPFDQVAGLASRRTYALTSSFRPTYNMAANLVRRYTPAEAHHLLNLSFAQYRTDRDVVAMERQLERARSAFDRARRHAQSDLGDVDEYRRLTTELERERAERGSGRRIGEALARLRPGDVVLSPRHGGRVVVLRQEPDRGRVLALDLQRDLVRLGSDDFVEPPLAVGHITLPMPYSPKHSAYRREVGERLTRVKPRSTKRPQHQSDRQSELQRALRDHPLANDPQVGERVKAAAQSERLARDVARLERRVTSRSESLARQFDRVQRVLEAWGYLEPATDEHPWELTDAGRILAGLNTELDLLLAETIRSGNLEGLDPPEVAAVVSCFAYERRGSESLAPAPPRKWTSSRVAKAWRALERTWNDLAANEDDAGLPETRSPDPGFSAVAARWAAGEELATLLTDDAAEELSGGDFVRIVKQLVDLLRQVAVVAPVKETADAAGAAADACFRGVVAASSAVTAVYDDEPTDEIDPNAGT
ncbi:MAG: DEAD/DEAH box helicase [Acidimicrobiia bacterium]